MLVVVNVAGSDSDSCGVVVTIITTGGPVEGSSVMTGGPVYDPVPVYVLVVVRVVGSGSEGSVVTITTTGGPVDGKSVYVEGPV